MKDLNYFLLEFGSHFDHVRQVSIYNRKSKSVIIVDTDKKITSLIKYLKKNRFL